MPTGRVSQLLCAGSLAFLAACSTPSEPVDVYDPYEATNRRIYERSVAVDRAVLRPVSNAYGEGVPEPVRRSVSNFAQNLDAPGDILNDVLQGQGEDAVHNLFRFVLNTTMGVGGLFDVALSIGLEPRATDFGETLHVWGAPEGAFIMLPVLGASTERDAAGKVVDFVLNPVRAVVPADHRWIGTTASVGRVVDNRYRLRTSIDSVLYDSADGYAQTRIIYLQNRRFQLGAGEQDYIDPYETAYDD